MLTDGAMVLRRPAASHARRQASEKVATPERRGFRPEVQGLRAVAVGLVVLYHFWPKRVTGGYIGVDVFFVISGFLITSHLLREVASTGTVSLRQFWARRIRRLLPASLLVLAVCAIATVLWIPETQWPTTARQIAASALYVQNWVLAGDAVDYLALGNVPTVVQHYWSLSVEEQFYVLWPVLLVVGLGIVRRTGRKISARTVMAVIVSVIGVALFAYSVARTASDPSWSYFATPTRLWELAIGAGLAMVPAVSSRSVRVLLGWAGMAAICGSAFLIDADTLFPGWVAAIPTLGAAAVIAAGATGAGAGVDRMLSWRPATFVGDISYSIYLWHWPVIVVAPFIVHRELAWPEKLGLIGAVVLVSWASKLWVEDRFQRAKPRTVAPVYMFAAAGMVVVVALGFGVRGLLEVRAEAAVAQALEEANSGCLGPAALENPDACGGVMGDGNYMVSPGGVALAQAEQPYPGCQQSRNSSDVLTCALGTDAETPDRVIALVGDSHATHWFPAMDALGRELNWRVLTYTKTSCPATVADRLLDSEENRDFLESCRAWLGGVQEEVVEDGADLVVVTSYSSAYGYGIPQDDLLGDPQTISADPAVDGYVEMWEYWQEAGLEVAVIAAIPRTQGDNVPDCLAAHPGDGIACATDRSVSVPTDPLVAAADRTAATLIDLTEQFCDDQRCYPVVGNVIVYHDYSHLTPEYAIALEPYIRAVLIQPT